MIWSLGSPPSIARRLPLLALATLALVVGVMLAASYVEVRTLPRMVADGGLERVTTQLAAILATPTAERFGRVGSAAARPLVRQYLEGPVAGSPRRGAHGARPLRDERPEPPVLFLSGYAGDAIVRHGVLTKGTPFLQKPFTPEALARKVREVLDAPARSA